jgi:hypothetical protein
MRGDSHPLAPAGGKAREAQTTEKTIDAGLAMIRITVFVPQMSDARIGAQHILLSAGQYL